MNISEKIKTDFIEDMDDDFNTPKAIAAIFGLINDTKNDLVNYSDDDKNCTQNECRN